MAPKRSRGSSSRPSSSSTSADIHLSLLQHLLDLLNPYLVRFRYNKEVSRFKNADDDCNGKGVVKGKTVKFDRTTINVFYGLEDIASEENKAFVETPNYPDVANFLWKQGTTWTYSHLTREPLSLPKATLRDQYTKAWHAFVFAWFYPSSHTSDVTKDRALLLYAILTGKSIDVGWVMHATIMSSARTSNRGLYFPLLITGLCKNAKVIYEDGIEVTQQPMRVLNKSQIASFKDDNAIAFARAGSSRP
ncbi:hypothetical protein TIFTF001_028471 [Ficus carica]|uniref:Putative plant transposon protein domain-containing protein n=1 Tax=Ficus carica TaxID=3494 RepID=A0AA88DPV4_FICCA|nr:hypothetical protein TIFTF001_028471 [Ficus carica]